jgi:hypothetical protein
MNTFPYFELIATKILLKSVNSNLKHNLEGISNFFGFKKYQKILVSAIVDPSV